ncbi:MAG: ABC transporter ATP-binding protein [Erysipelotrichaceae bacterium]|nr:ABC transporter ATP-binding protein [Erysipelotrichaceae bacterium]MBR2545333.1 ABC transporter ATP-binding protein [Erysipelotrichaceae bacterium]MBR2701076.1 ABC transporter ATP-binding protein [Erysipelotrichaceae bacterium]MBR2746286.1 ABC transporter ATP-binding protein [Erysipelotrichaceae bacterium]MBR2792744.1 ABC transporter ATP-binding protein [Erysipelotrichaceae bacterium]
MKIRLENIVKRFRDNTAVDHFSAVIESGELVTLLGPSGCGKSTMLNMLSGILYPTEGKIYFDDDDVTFVSSEKRGIGLVFQNYALYPHMTVLENICFPLEIQKVPKAERIERAKKMAELVHVDTMLNRKPGQLSGGQQQRVAIARALVKQPRLLLLDEPLSNLDARLRIEMREEIRRIQLETGVTTIFVTHDQEEAMSISDHIILMKLGVLQQFDKPQYLYDQPANCFVADFLGNPPINKVEAKVENGKVILADGQDSGVRLEGHDGEKVWLSFRSESVLYKPESELRAKVILTSVMGKEKITSFDLAGKEVRGYFDSSLDFERGEEVGIGFKKTGVFVFNFESGERYL